MGFLSKIFGGGEPKKPRPSAQDIANAEFASYRAGLDKSVGDPLRARQIEIATDPAVEQSEYGFFSSRANADAAQADSSSFESMVQQAQASGKSIKSVRSEAARRENLIAEARSEGLQDAKVSTTLRGDERRLNASKAGEALAAQTQNTLAAQSDIDTNSAISRLKSDQTKNNAKAQMYGDILAAAATVGLNEYGKKKDADLQAAQQQRVASEGLRQGNVNTYSGYTANDPYGLPKSLDTPPTIKALENARERADRDARFFKTLGG